MGEGDGQVAMSNGVVRTGLMRWKQLDKDLKKVRELAIPKCGGRSSNYLVLYLGLCPNNFSNRKQNSKNYITVIILDKALPQTYLDSNISTNEYSSIPFSFHFLNFPPLDLQTAFSLNLLFPSLQILDTVPTVFAPAPA